MLNWIKQEKVQNYLFSNDTQYIYIYKYKYIYICINSDMRDSEKRTGI